MQIHITTTKLEYKFGTSDKVYDVSLYEIIDSKVPNVALNLPRKFGVSVSYGRRTNPNKVNYEKTPSSGTDRKNADKIFTKLVNEKLGKGYSVAALVHGPEKTPNIPDPEPVPKKKGRVVRFVSALLDDD